MNAHRTITKSYLHVSDSPRDFACTSTSGPGGVSLQVTNLGAGVKEHVFVYVTKSEISLGREMFTRRHPASPWSPSLCDPLWRPQESHPWVFVGREDIDERF